MLKLRILADTVHSAPCRKVTIETPTVTEASSIDSPTEGVIAMQQTEKHEVKEGVCIISLEFEALLSAPGRTHSE